jgi:hypothetical protein
MEPNRIGIPGEIIGRHTGFRFDIRPWAEGLIVIDKPQGITSRPDPFYPDAISLEVPINLQAAAEKPELQHHGISKLSIFNSLEPEVPGLVLASITEASRGHWKNAYGSQFFTFHSVMVCKPHDPTVTTIECKLPLARHHVGKYQMVSHNLGKKSITRMTLVEASRHASIWIASTRYPRPHQIRVHSRESGLFLLQDPLYDTTPQPETASILAHGTRRTGRGQVKKEKPMAPRLEWIHSIAIAADAGLGCNQPIQFCPLPRFWRGFLRRLELDPIPLEEKMTTVIQNITLPIE